MLLRLTQLLVFSHRPGCFAHIALARHVASKLSEKKITMIDAPVSGGVGGAEAGTLTFMVGATPQDFEVWLLRAAVSDLLSLRSAPSRCCNSWARILFTVVAAVLAGVHRLYSPEFKALGRLPRFATTSFLPFP
jgi:hypothetical protein